MEVDPTTFLMEVINFLILVWIMNRILYRPVRGIITERQAALERIRNEAELLRSEALELKQEYQGRLGSWDEEKAVLRRDLQGEIDDERRRMRALLEEELAGMRDKARIAEERRAEELNRLSEERAITGAARFAARLLTRVATPEQTERFLEMLLEDLGELPDDRRRAIAEALGGNGVAVRVVSAHPLDGALRRDFESRFRAMFPSASRFSFMEDATLLAGARVIAGPWNLAANLKDELSFFRGGINDG